LADAALAASNYGKLYPVSMAIAATFLKAFINICGIEAELTIPNSKDNPVILEAPY